MKKDTLIQQNFLQKRTLSFRYLKFLLASYRQGQASLTKVKEFAAD
ncbi:hypothetical protein PSR59_05495 [Ligilactobacillus ruminis]|uniref:Uncharacterized protein n=1 Tax=Ligilactobacillus ruminis TaxID=1623 RepID=A0AAQ3ASU9_9LACO|nr:hypothetical protein [Ligilactobacillus ruminis]WDC81165.1 hypothetical protein PSR59_05495 [Ligilactobacillus ruminis]